MRPRYSRTMAMATVSMAESRKKTVRETKVARMLQLAAECGYVCEPTTKYRHELGLAITSKLVHRRGLDVYQSAAFSIALFSLKAGRDMFGEANLTTDSPQCLTWKIDTMPELAAFFGNMLGESGKLCSGLTRGLRTVSEPTIHALAMLIPPFELSIVEMARGVSRAYVNLMYTLWDQGGGMHPPKDAERRELSYSSTEVSGFRVKVLADARRLAAQGAPLSSAWFNLLGLHQEALLVEAAEQEGRGIVVVPKAKGEKRKRNQWVVDTILD